VALLAILIIVNMGAARLDVQWDMTEANIYSLSEKSLETVRNIDKPVTIYFFHSQRAGGSTFNPTRLRTLLRQYASSSSEITFREVDHIRRPGFARKHGIGRRNNVVLIEADGQTTKLGRYDLMEFGGPRGRQRKFRGESAITTALINLTRSTDKVIYFATGFGEYTTDRSRNRSVSRWAETLRQQGYETELFNPLADNLPDTRDMIVILDPKKGYSDGVIEQFRRWNRQGGSLLVAGSPRSAESINPILEGVGLTLRSFRIVDPNRRVSGLQSLVNPYIFAPKLGNHPSLSSLKEQGYAVQMGLSTPVSINDTSTVDRLLLTSPAAYGKSLTGGTETEYNPASDVTGPFTVAAFSGGDKRGKLFVFGSATLFGNRMFARIPGNKTFAVNLVNWNFDREVSLGIQATPSNYNRVTVTAAQSYFIKIIALLIIPVGILLWGGWVWWNRKNR
jgi:ABC-type uncharacterized transport system involved in gliding motility auxiliary subunit